MLGVLLVQTLTLAGATSLHLQPFHQGRRAWQVIARRCGPISALTRAGGKTKEPSIPDTWSCLVAFSASRWPRCSASPTRELVCPRSRTSQGHTAQSAPGGVPYHPPSLSPSQGILRAAMPCSSSDPTTAQRTSAPPCKVSLGRGRVGGPGLRPPPRC